MNNLYFLGPTSHTPLRIIDNIENINDMLKLNPDEINSLCNDVKTDWSFIFTGHPCNPLNSGAGLVFQKLYSQYLNNGNRVRFIGLTINSIMNILMKESLEPDIKD